jgi:hypothetical protein
MPTQRKGRQSRDASGKFASKSKGVKKGSSKAIGKNGRSSSRDLQE